MRSFLTVSRSRHPACGAQNNIDDLVAKIVRYRWNVHKELEEVMADGWRKNSRYQKSLTREVLIKKVALIRHLLHRRP